MVEMGRHEGAVARSLGFAQEAGAESDFVSAVAWPRLVRGVDGALRPDRERTLAGWIDRMRAAELSCEPEIGSPQTPNLDPKWVLRD